MLTLYSDLYRKFQHAFSKLLWKLLQFYCHLCLGDQVTDLKIPWAVMIQILKPEIPVLKPKVCEHPELNTQYTSLTVLQALSFIFEPL